MEVTSLTDIGGTYGPGLSVTWYSLASYEAISAYISNGQGVKALICTISPLGVWATPSYVFGYTGRNQATTALTDDGMVGMVVSPTEANCADSAVSTTITVCFR